MESDLKNLTNLKDGTKLGVPYRLGPFQIPHPFILAPMAGITHSPFRRLMKRKRSALVISELVSVNGLEHASRRTRELLKFKDDERLIGLQVFGEKPELLVRACTHIESLGADFVDLNLGCPVPKVVKKGAGAAMCRDPVALGKTLKSMVEAVKIPVTIKIRTGWDAQTINAHEVVKAAADAGVAWVAVHGRTRAQGYSGEANWDLIGEIKARSSVPILGNGDVTTPELAVKRYRDYGVDAVLVGRGALRNPFIFEQSASLLEKKSYSVPEFAHYAEVLSDLRELFEENYDERMALIHSRKFLSWFASGFRGCHAFRSEVFQEDRRDHLWNRAYSFFETAYSSRDMSFLSQPFLMGGHG